VFSQDIIYLRPTGNTGAYEYADPHSPVSKEADRLFANNSEVRLAAATYKKIQLEKKLGFKKQLESTGMSPDEVNLLMSNYKIKPVYIILSDNQGGNACLLGDLKIVQKNPSGSITQKIHSNTPAVHLAMNGNTIKNNDIADITRSVCHEISHGSMALAYGGQSNFPKTDFLGKPHWRGMVSDEGLALIEGWAEANGPYFSKGSQYNTHLRENRYAFKEDGTLKNDKEMRATEGVAASIFFAMINGSAGIEDGYSKIMNIFAKARPAGFSDFEKSFAVMYPEDAEKMFDLVTASTFCANISPLSADMYTKLLYGEITAQEYSQWVKNEKKRVWPEYYKNLTIRDDLSKGGLITDFNHKGSANTMAADAFYVPVEDVETGVKKGGAAYIEDLDNPFANYIELVKAGKKNTPQGKQALLDALEESRRREQNATAPADPEYSPVFDQKDRGVRIDQKDRGTRFDQKDRGSRIDQ
jgi:hypothetical protein